MRKKLAMLLCCTLGITSIQLPAFAAQPDYDESEILDDTEADTLSEKIEEMDENASEAEIETEIVNSVSDDSLTELSDDNSEDAEAADSIVRGPREVVRGENVIYDQVYLGSYPQAEIIDYAYKYDAIDFDCLSEGDFIESPELLVKLKGSSFVNDVTTIDGVKYKRVAKKSLPSSDVTATYYRWSTDTSEYHYFKYEPLKWRVIEIDTGRNTVLLMSEKVIDGISYSDKEEKITWKESSVRKQLNDGFYNDAFSAEDKALINTTYNNNKGPFSTEAAAEEPSTMDEVFLFNVSDVGTSFSGVVDTTTRVASHGFVTNLNYYDNAKRARSTTYARAVGVAFDSVDAAFRGNSAWWLKSRVHDVPGMGAVSRAGYVMDSSVKVMLGIRPVIEIKADKLTSEMYAGEVSTGTFKYGVAGIEKPKSPEEIIREKAFKASLMNVQNERAAAMADIKGTTPHYIKVQQTYDDSLSVIEEYVKGKIKRCLIDTTACEAVSPNEYQGDITINTGVKFELTGNFDVKGINAPAATFEIDNISISSGSGEKFSNGSKELYIGLSEKDKAKIKKMVNKKGILAPKSIKIDGVKVCYQFDLNIKVDNGDVYTVHVDVRDLNYDMLNKQYGKVPCIPGIGGSLYPDFGGDIASAMWYVGNDKKPLEIGISGVPIIIKGKTIAIAELPDDGSPIKVDITGETIGKFKVTTVVNGRKYKCQLSVLDRSKFPE